jgi:hypothetical protein
MTMVTRASQYARNTAHSVIAEALYPAEELDCQMARKTERNAGSEARRCRTKVDDSDERTTLTTGAGSRPTYSAESRLHMVPVLFVHQELYLERLAESVKSVSVLFFSETWCDDPKRPARETQHQLI